MPRSRLLGAFALLAGCSAPAAFQTDFQVGADDWSSVGRNEWFVLVPGCELRFEDERGREELVVRVLEETQLVDGVETRVVEERETSAGALKEVSRNFFAIARSTRGLYYFGEDVDIYAQGVVVSHAGQWRSGVRGARFGMLLPGTARLGARWYQEQAPEVAFDRSEIVSLDGTPAWAQGKYAKCLVIEETTPLEPGARARKVYAPGIGLIEDGELHIVSCSIPDAAR